MEEAILRINNLTKQYKGITVVDNVGLKINKGVIYGLVGANGAGKTSLIRMLTGQAQPTSGEISLFGKSTQSDLNEMRKRTGVIVETPCFYPFFSASENLEYYRIQRGIKRKLCIEEVLTEVGLEDTGKKKFKNFSLGMKQRLGLALALLNNPEFLILDEPINGLDPVGIMEFRKLLLKLNQERGITVLIASHILSELESLATHYCFIKKGKVVKEISAEELFEQCNEYIELKVSEVNRVEAILKKDFNCNKYDILPNGIIKIYDKFEHPEKLFKKIVGDNIEIYSMNVKKASLEDYFMNILGDKSHA